MADSSFGSKSARKTAHSLDGERAFDPLSWGLKQRLRSAQARSTSSASVGVVTPKMFSRPEGELTDAH